MVERTHPLLNSKMVKKVPRKAKYQFWVELVNFNGRYALQDHEWKISAVKQGFGFTVHTRIFKMATFQE